MNLSEMKWKQKEKEWFSLEDFINKGKLMSFSKLMNINEWSVNKW